MVTVPVLSVSSDWFLCKFQPVDWFTSGEVEMNQVPSGREQKLLTKSTC